MTTKLLEALEACWPTASWEDCDCLLWMTPFPVASEEVIIARIHELRAKYGENITAAINGEMVEFDRQWEEHKARNPE